MKIKVRETKGITVLDIEGRIDIDASELIETVGWVVKNNKLRILCNFENVELVDYSGLSILAIAYKNVANHQGQMRFCAVGLHIRELFNIVQMDKVFRCYDTEEQAIMNFDEKIMELEKKNLRRRFQRVETAVEVAYSPKNSKGGKVYTGKLVNLSGAGFFILTHNILPIRTKLNLDITLPKGLAPLEMEGMVIWIAEKNLQSHCYPGMGIQFINVEPGIQKELLDFIDKNVTHRSET